MEAEVTTDVSGLIKFVKFNSLSIDAAGNFNISVTKGYKDANGDVLAYQDQAKGEVIITGMPPVTPGALTLDEMNAQTKHATLIAALGPVITSLVQGNS